MTYQPHQSEALAMKPVAGSSTPSLPQAVLTDAESMIATLKSQVRIGRARWHSNKQQSNVIEVTFADADAIIAALSRMGGESVPAWQPMATVPSEGWVVVAAEGGAIRIESARYVHHHINAAKVDGDSCYFTHWQPLPAAPTAPAQLAACSYCGTVHGDLEACRQQAADVQGERRPVTAFEDATLRKAAMRSATVVSAGAAAQSVPKAGAVSDTDIKIAVYAQCPGFDEAHEGPDMSDMLAVVRAVLDIAASAPTVGGEKDPITLAIQRLNANAYNLTKAECIEELRALQDRLAAQEPSAAAEPVACRHGHMRCLACMNNRPPTPPSAPAGAGGGEPWVAELRELIEAAIADRVNAGPIKLAFGSNDWKIVNILWPRLDRIADALSRPSAPPSHEGEDAHAKHVIDAARVAMNGSYELKDDNIGIQSIHAAILSLALDEYDAARAGGSQ